MNRGPNPPAELEAIQYWFASIITRPIDENSRMIPISPSGKPMDEEARDFIVPSPTLEPHQRIQIYNQQYWWRLLSNLHELYPLLTRLFGYRDFNHVIGMPFLLDYPANHWSLAYLGDRLPLWLNEEYRESDKRLVLDSAWIDWAFNNSFYANELEQISALIHSDGIESDSFLNKKLILQPHLHLFYLDCDMFQFRYEFLQQDPDYWNDHDFPELSQNRDHSFVLYRNLNKNITWTEVSKQEYAVLKCFQEPTTIEEIAGWLEKQDFSLIKEVKDHLHLWFQKWTYHQWLGIPESHIS